MVEVWVWCKSVAGSRASVVCEMRVRERAVLGGAGGGERERWGGELVRVREGWRRVEEEERWKLGQAEGL